MRRDSIFFRLFQQFPMLLFELLDNPPADADRYRFDSVAVKETKFEIDGVFLPPSGRKGIVYFSEVQFQLDKQLYERLWSESSRYFFQNRQRFSDWQAVVIYPSRSMEQKDLHPHRSLLQGDQVHRVYLNELGDIEALPLGLAAMVLTTKTKRVMPGAARGLVNRAQQAAINSEEKRAIIDVISTIVVHQFTKLSRREVDEMLGIRLEETRVYQEAREEGAIAMLSILLVQKFGDLPDYLTERLNSLTKEQSERLAIALKNLETIADLETWFAANR
jgi:predicted transposase/invertase (TIGR01784 family)